MSNFFELVAAKAYANLRVEVSRYYLNYLWWLIEPILSMLVFYVVFGIFLNRGTPNYVGFLLIGLVHWQWFSNGVIQSANSILSNKGLMMQVDIPKIFFPLEIILRGTFKHIFVTVILLLFLLFYPIPVAVTWLALPVLFVIQALYVLSIGVICAAIVPFLPDLQFVISTIIRLAVYASGIFFDINAVVKPEHRYIMYLNPIAGLVKNYREILMYGNWPDWLYLGYIALAGVLLLFLAILLLKSLDHVYPRICQR
jgi:lipopolysaccharide transport system permease protein